MKQSEFRAKGHLEGIFYTLRLLVVISTATEE